MTISQQLEHNWASEFRCIFPFFPYYSSYTSKKKWKDLMMRDHMPLENLEIWTKYIMLIEWSSKIIIASLTNFYKSRQG